MALARLVPVALVLLFCSSAAGQNGAALTYVSQSGCGTPSSCVTAGYNAVFDLAGNVAITSRDTSAADNCVSFGGTYSGSYPVLYGGTLTALGTDGNTYTGTITGGNTFTVVPYSVAPSCTYTFSLGPMAAATAYGVSSLSFASVSPSGCSLNLPDAGACLTSGYLALSDPSGNIAFVSKDSNAANDGCNAYLGQAQAGSSLTSGTFGISQACNSGSCSAVSPGVGGSYTATQVTVAMSGCLATFTRAASILTTANGQQGATALTIQTASWPTASSKSPANIIKPAAGLVAAAIVAMFI